MENIYKQITSIIKNEVKIKHMGCIYRCLLQKAINEKLFYTIKKNDIIIAFAICRFLKTKNLLSIDKIGVHPDYRGQNIGTELINQIKSNQTNIRIDVVSENTKAVKFYEKNGFIKTGNKILGSNINVTIMIYEY